MTKHNNQKVVIPETILWRKDEGKVVVFDEERGEPYLLNETATRIWELCDRGEGIDKIIALLLEEFEGDPVVIEKETLTLLTTLQDKRLLRLDLDGA